MANVPLGLTRLALQFAELPRRCARDRAPGVNEIPEWADWSERETTHDQARIEGWLAERGVGGLRLLHVGVGNSSLAQRFAGSAHHIDGVTVQAMEVMRAAQLRLPRYRVHLLNKFDSALPSRLGRRYDLIVDNNPTAFACCWEHFATMLASYVRLLQRGGLLLTERRGLGHAVTGNHSRWCFTPEDWHEVGRAAGLVPCLLTDAVLGLERPAPAWQQPLASLRSALRSVLR